MNLGQILRSELEMEAASARKCIERLNDDQLGWKPHPKSMSAGQLVSHLVEIPGWTGATVEKEELDLAPPGAGYQPKIYATVADALADFDAAIEKAKAALAGARDESFGEPWSLLSGGHKIFTIPRGGAIRVLVLSHFIHHRGQLSVYLRLLDIPVPSIYGPSADEGM